MSIDVNVHLGRWPFRRLPCDETLRLIDKLRVAGVQEAWAGSFDGLLHRDLSGVNFRVSEECRTSGGLLRPVGTINPSQTGWQEELRRCHEQYGMTVIRMYPNYHSYTLDLPDCHELLTSAHQRRMIVQIALKMEDERTHHPLMRVPPVDVAPLESLIQRHPQSRIVILNHQVIVRNELAAKLATLGEVYWDISHAEQVGALESAIQWIPYQKLVFGSHFPFFVLDAVTGKFQESALGAAVEQAIRTENAKRLLDWLETGSVTQR